MLTFTCPICRCAYRAPPGSAGKKIACQKCGQRIRIPEPPAAQNKTVLGEVSGLQSTEPLTPSLATVLPEADQRPPRPADLGDGSADEEAEPSHARQILIYVSLGIAAVVVMVGVIIWAATFDPDEFRRRQKERETEQQKAKVEKEKKARESTLIQKAHDAIRVQLRAPRDAVFVSTTVAYDAPVADGATEACVMIGEVDSQNALGVFLRAHWIVVFDRSWNVKSALLVTR
jgi:hypothetical protein